jgi:hypothetical protein
MPWLLSFLIYFITSTFILTSIANFFIPVTRFISLLILFSSILSSSFGAFFIPLNIFLSGHSLRKLPKIPLWLFFFAMIIWAVVAIYRPTTESDATGYHLPIALLMNYSVWYPGIGQLSSTFGFPNGTSVLASIFTSFDILSLENIPNLLIWFILGMGIFSILVHNISTTFSFLLTLMFIFSPDFFWQSYNMATDLPCACFLFFGLIALSEDSIEDSFLFLALSAVFKTIGVLAFSLASPYLFFCFIKRQKSISPLHPKIVMSILLFLLSILRVYIATGNPIYPSLALNLASWGISSDIQYNFIKSELISYSGVDFTPFGLIMFLIYLFILPHKFNSSYWFSPFFVITLVASIHVCLSTQRYKLINLRHLYSSFILISLLLAWFLYSPLFRFIIGLFLFVNIKLLIFTYKSKMYNSYKPIIMASLCITLALFMVNAVRHIYQDVIPIIDESPQAIDKYMPWVKGSDSGKFTVKYTEDGFMYSKSTTQYCQKMRPPCVSARSLENEDILIKEFRKYNNM